MPQRSHTLSHPAPVIALHCSGAGAGQWRQLGEALAPRHELVAPEHYGCESTGPWSGEHAFTLADEAARTIEIIDRSDGQVHLVGHSYGGGVALRAAVERPNRIASLTLYEPSAFHLLRAMGARAADALAEILGLAARTAEGVITGNYRGAAASFVDYWSGRGAWAALRPSVQAALTRWMPKAPLDFRALDRRRTRSLRRRRLPAECRRGPCVRIQSSLFMAAAEAPTTRRISLALDSTAGTTDPVRRFGGHTNGDFRENISCSRPGEQACDPPRHSLPKRCS